ncbi:hypothetical protein AVEN_249919-1 [Araneus ventricosus]|uniref:Uncharacterized protein n=1 Tax=Araneus ventricosus TaxID=182803 RepID=A0A4Y2DXL4_ARAVE|nr:hypothetical protein AVEN_249919-1 [Araneus ventricosus]
MLSSSGHQAILQGQPTGLECGFCLWEKARKFLYKGPVSYRGYTENGLELQTSKNTVDVIDQSRSKNVLSSENGLELYHEKSVKSTANISDRYVPNGELGNLSDYDIGLFKEDHPAISKSSAEGKSGSNYIFRDQIFNDCINRKENIINELDRNGTGLEHYIQEFSKDLEKMHKSNSPDESRFQSDKLKRSCTGIYNSNKETNFTNSCEKLSSDAEYSFYKTESPCSFSEFVALKNNHSSCDAQVDKHQITEQQSFSQNSDDFSFGDSGTFTTLNNFEMPHSFNKSETLKNDDKCFDHMKLHQHSKYKILSQGSDDLSPNFFSSGESSTLTSLHNFEKPHVSSCFARPKNDHPNYCDDKVDKRQLSKHPSFSQSSDNFSSDIFSSGESGTLISSNENVLSENEHIGLADILHRSCNTSPDTLLKSESVMDEDSFDYSLTPPQRNCDIITSPDIFCDMKQDVRRVGSDFSVDNILSKSCVKNSPLFSPNSERYLDYNIHEPNYNVPFIHNSAFSNVVDNRFINYFGMNNYSQNLPLHALPPFAQIGNYPTMNMGSAARYSNTVANDDICAMDTYCPNNAPDFNHSMYANEDMGNYLRVPIKQEDAESFLPPEELSYSLNNFANSGYCFSQRNFHTR